MLFSYSDHCKLKPAPEVNSEDKFLLLFIYHYWYRIEHFDSSEKGIAVGFFFPLFWGEKTHIVNRFKCAYSQGYAT